MKAASLEVEPPRPLMGLPGDLLRTVYGAGYTATMSMVALTRVAVGDRGAVRRMTGPWTRHLCRTMGVQVTGEGIGDLAAPCIIVANHQSLIDILALYQVLPMRPSFIAKNELRRVPLFGPAMEHGDHIFVDRSTRRKAVEAIHEAANEIRKRNVALVIFPEGTRGDGTRLLPFKSGAFHLAKLSGVPVVPVGIHGTAAILGKHRRLVRPGQVKVRFGEPLSPDMVSTMPVLKLKELLRQQIAELADLPLGT